MQKRKPIKSFTINDYHAFVYENYAHLVQPDSDQILIIPNDEAHDATGVLQAALELLVAWNNGEAIDGQ